MKYIKIALLLLFVLVGMSFSVQVASAFGFGMSNPLGGRITQSTKATEIQTQENANYKCIVPGRSFSMNPVGNTGAPRSYLIPAGVSSKTGNALRQGQWILGLFNPSRVSITCIFQGEPPATTVVPLTPVTLYGTSR